MGDAGDAPRRDGAPARGHALRRIPPAPRPGLLAGAPPADPLPRRAHGGRRSGGAAPVLDHHPRAGGPGHDHDRHHPLHGRGRALRAPGVPLARPAHRDRNAGRGPGQVRRGRHPRGHLRGAPGEGDVNRGRLRAIFWKEFIQMRRDTTTLRLMLIVPVMQLLIFGYAIRQDVRKLPTAVFDMSRTQESRAFVDRLVSTDNFRVTRMATSYEEALALIDKGRVRASVVIPETFARDLKRGRATEVQVLIDATDPTASQSAIAAAQLVGQRQNLDILSARTGLPVDGDRLLVDVRVRPLYNPALESALYIVPGIIGMLLSNILIIITAISVVREREQGTLEQLIVTPLTRTEIMLGKIAPYV